MTEKNMRDVFTTPLGILAIFAVFGLAALVWDRLFPLDGGDPE